MADETNTNTNTPAPPAADTSKTATEAAAEADGEMKLEAPAAPAMSAEQAEQVRREAYAKATGKDQGGESAGSNRSSQADSSETGGTDDDDGEFDPDNGVDDDGEPVRGKGAGGQPAPEKGAPDRGAHKDAGTPEQRTAIVKATQALRLDGWTDDDIADMPAAKVIRLGNAARERHSRTAAALREAADIRKGAAARSDSAGNGARRDSQTTTAREEQRAPKADRLDALLAELEGETPAADDAAGDPPAPQETEELKATRQALESARAELDALNLDRGLKSLYGEFPALRGEKAKSAVLARMSELDPEGKALRDHQRLTRLIRDAAYIEFGPQLSEEARAARKEKARMQRDGQPDAAGDNREPAKRRTTDEIRRAAYETARAGTLEESRRAFKAKVGAA